MMSSKLWQPIEDFINELADPMTVVHHYTSVQGALGILSSGQFWLTERAHLNDPSEISHGVDIAKNLLRSQGQQDMAECLDKAAERVLRDFRFFSGSFTFKDDDLNQWRNYADDGRGVVLSFKSSVFCNVPTYINKLMQNNKNVFVCPMSYSVKKLQSIIEKIVKEWDGINIEELCDHIFKISSMFKDECWSDEKEYRLFVHGAKEDFFKSIYYKSRVRGGEIISYLDIPIQNWDSKRNCYPICGIRLGPAAPSNLDVQFADFLLSKGITHKIARSRLPYRSFRADVTG